MPRIMSACFVALRRQRRETARVNRVWAEIIGSVQRDHARRRRPRTLLDSSAWRTRADCYADRIPYGLLHDSGAMFHHRKMLRSALATRPERAFFGLVRTGLYRHWTHRRRAMPCRGFHVRVHLMHLLPCGAWSVALCTKRTSDAPSTLRSPAVDKTAEPEGVEANKTEAQVMANR